MLYLNTCIRGYPKGLRAGTDPRKPLISVDEHFEKIEYRSVPSVLFSIEVNFWIIKSQTHFDLLNEKIICFNKLGVWLW